MGVGGGAHRPGACAAARVEAAIVPTIMSSVDQIMKNAKSDVFFVEFDWMTNSDAPARKRHFEWFRAHGLRWQTAAPRGFLEGDPGLNAVNFDGPGDPRVAEYAAEFEDADGKSLEPDAYQMYRLEYASWSEKRRARAAEDGQDDDGEL